MIFFITIQHTIVQFLTLSFAFALSLCHYLQSLKHTHEHLIKSTFYIHARTHARAHVHTRTRTHTHAHTTVAYKISKYVHLCITFCVFTQSVPLRNQLEILDGAAEFGMLIETN